MGEKPSRYETLDVRRAGPVATVTLNRPEVRNAFNEVMIGELIAAFVSLGGEESVRVVVLTGAGGAFSAGADLEWMRRSSRYTFDENLADASRLAECLECLYSLPKPTIARVNGPAIGGGVGLVAACDIAIASESALLGLSEVRLGLVPAVIAPYLVRRAGEGRCRALFLTGTRLTGSEAHAAGLVNRTVMDSDLDRAVEETASSLLEGGPAALASCKRLLAQVAEAPLEEARAFTARMIAEMRSGKEAQEGMAAFLEKRRPSWRTK
jgi:methylglutaconyl-CoA hydratase